MADVYCDIWKKQDGLTPATMTFRVQREDEPDTTLQDVRCGTAHEGQAAGAVALMRRHLASAAMYRKLLHRESVS